MAHGHVTASGKISCKPAASQLLGSTGPSWLLVGLVFLSGCCHIARTTPYFGTYHGDWSPNSLKGPRRLPLRPFTGHVRPSSPVFGGDAAMDSPFQPGLHMKRSDDILEPKRVVLRGGPSNKKLLMRIFKRGGGPQRPRMHVTSSSSSADAQQQLTPPKYSLENMSLEKLEEITNNLFRAFCKDHEGQMSEEEIESCRIFQEEEEEEEEDKLIARKLFKRDLEEDGNSREDQKH